MQLQNRAYKNYNIKKLKSFTCGLNKSFLELWGDKLKLNNETKTHSSNDNSSIAYEHRM